VIFYKGDSMNELEAFTWHGDNGEKLRFADLSPIEQRTALLATGGLLRTRQKAQEQAQSDEGEASSAA
jgi:hypothetical protein